MRAMTSSLLSCNLCNHRTMPQIHFAFEHLGQHLRSSITKTRDVKLIYRQCNTQSFPVVCDSPSPGTSWRNRENPAPLRVHVSATIGTETVATLVKVRRMRLCAFSEVGRGTHASTNQSDPLLLPMRNGPCRGDGALHWEYLF